MGWRQGGLFCQICSRRECFSLMGAANLPLYRRSVSWFRLDVYWFYLDQSCVKPPVADAFELGKLLLCGLDRPFGVTRGSNDDRALAAAEKLFVPGNFIDETYAITLHLSPSHPTIDDPIGCRSCDPMTPSAEIYRGPHRSPENPNKHGPSESCVDPYQRCLRRAHYEEARPLPRDDGELVKPRTMRRTLC